MVTRGTPDSQEQLIERARKAGIYMTLNKITALRRGPETLQVFYHQRIFFEQRDL